MRRRRPIERGGLPFLPPLYLSTRARLFLYTVGRFPRVLFPLRLPHFGKRLHLRLSRCREGGSIVLANGAPIAIFALLQERLAASVALRSESLVPLLARDLLFAYGSMRIWKVPPLS